jgi:DNA-directed RNA polymerase subunit K/omega
LPYSGGFMAIKTLDLSKIEQLTSNIYTACLVIAKRAREINADRISKRKEKEIIEESGYDQELDAYDREFLENIEYEKEINPTVIAQEELFEGRLKTKFKTEETEEKIPPSE